MHGGQTEMLQNGGIQTFHCGHRNDTAMLMCAQITLAHTHTKKLLFRFKWLNADAIQVCVCLTASELNDEAPLT